MPHNIAHAADPRPSLMLARAAMAVGSWPCKAVLQEEWGYGSISYSGFANGQGAPAQPPATPNGMGPTGYSIARRAKAKGYGL